MNLLDLILQSAGEGVYGLDCEGRTTFVNPAAARLLGYPAEELIGELMHALLHHSHPDGSEFPREECPIYAAFKDGKVHHVENEVFWRRDGSSFPVEYTSTPIFEEDTLCGAVVVFWDITDRRQTEEQLRQAWSQVEQLKDRLQDENLYLKEEIRTERNFDEIIGETPVMKELLREIETVAPTDANVLIAGETGTGKELIARAIHDLSPRSASPLIKVNCASIPRELFESEFFGHVRGSYTGAVRDRTGRFGLADGGTLFLDEVGEIPLEMQGKLLRVLQEGQYERVGEERTRSVDVRVLAATNRDLEQEIVAGRFRQDLFYRLNVYPLESPPLRRRQDDIPVLARHFLESVLRRIKGPDHRLTRSDVRSLKEYDWPGNVRELQNVIERAVISARSGPLQFSLSTSSVAPTVPAEENVDTDTVISDVEMKRRETENLVAALTATHWRVYGPGGAAELLGMKPSTLASRMKKFGLEKPR